MISLPWIENHDIWISIFALFSAMIEVVYRASKLIQGMTLIYKLNTMYYYWARSTSLISKPLCSYIKTSTRKLVMTWHLMSSFLYLMTVTLLFSQASRLMIDIQILWFIYVWYHILDFHSWLHQRLSKWQWQKFNQNDNISVSGYVKVCSVLQGQHF